MTNSIENDHIQQYTIRPKTKETYKNRSLSLTTISPEECQDLNYKLMRLPRGLDLITPLSKKEKQYYISFKPKHK